MRELNAHDLRPLIDMVRAMPAPRTIPAAELLAPFTKCRCGHKKRADRMAVIKTPMVSHAYSDVCADCPSRAEMFRADSHQVRFVCVGCRSLVAVVPPHVNKETGGRLVAGGTYHLLGCPNCTDDVKRRVMEIVRPDFDPNKDVEFESKIFEVFRLKSPTTALSCLTKILSPSL